jgi:type II secretory pathway pseudopilin PulG
MFSLLVTIIAIALVALVALVAIYYGGSAINEGTDQAAVSRYLSEGTQVQGALELYRVDNNGQLPTGTSLEIQQQLLDGHYLKSWPTGQWTLVNDYAVRTDMTATVCLAVNKKLGVNVIPTCGDPAYTGHNVCCTTL